MPHHLRRLLLPVSCLLSPASCFLPRPPHFLLRHHSQQQQRFVQFIFRSRGRPCLGGDLLNGSRIQNPKFIIVAGLKRAPCINSVRASFLQRRIVEECVRPRAQDFVRQRRGLG